MELHTGHTPLYHRRNKRLQKIFNKRVCYFVNVYHFNKPHMKCRKSFDNNAYDKKPSIYLFSSNCVEMNFADCCTNELQFWICTHCKKYSLQSLQTLEKCQNYQHLLAFLIFHNKWVNLSMFIIIWTFKGLIIAPDPTQLDEADWLSVVTQFSIPMSLLHC